MPDTLSPYTYSYDRDKADEIWAILKKSADELGVSAPRKDICAQIFGNSPFLAETTRRMPNECLSYLTQPADHSFDALCADLAASRPKHEKRLELMAFLRICKARLSLITAIADITGAWPLEKVTDSLSKFADAALDLSLGRLVHERMTVGDLPWPNGSEESVSASLGKTSGYFILGMGKLGANELNYSSDIDLIVLYDSAAIKYTGPKTLSQCWIKVTQDLVQMIEQRTMHGYVFRTDLRLRPDPGATPVAITVEAAESYYHSMAINWERSAMIKARVAAGDIKAGAQYLQNLSGWVWRRNMDFAALDDIAAIKNQINRHYDQDKELGPGYNVKLGLGGIREIEFFAQVNQLLHAGRHPSLRLRGTLQALAELQALKLLEADAASALTSAYVFLRTLEHRIQMVDDAQTHELPKNQPDMDRIALFMKFKDRAELLTQLSLHTQNVSKIYDGLLPDHQPQNTGDYSEPHVANTIEKLGFPDAAGAVSLIEGWRRGRHRALRTQRAKGLLEQCLPILLEAFSQTENPSAALLRFDKFISQLPTGVQLFSLLHSNPSLFSLLARVIGLAPALADTLAKKPELWDMVLEPSFFASVENEADLMTDLGIRLGSARDFQDVLDLVRKFVAEQKFRTGVHLLESIAGVEETGAALTRVADVALKTLVPYVGREFARRHGVFPGGGIAILAMGKYGGQELTQTSDLDIVFLYHAQDMSQLSDGTKPLMPSQYFSRLGQNIITAITALTPEGRLFEVDTRLRPSGQQGPLVVTLKTFQDYYAQSAWTWEHMALTRARIIISPEAMLADLRTSVESVLAKKRDATALLTAVHKMRKKLFDQFGSENMWAVKHCRGGLVDMEFICQYLMLKNGHTHPAVFKAEISKAIITLKEHNILSADDAAFLEQAHLFLQKIQSLLRLSLGRAPETVENIPRGLYAVLLKAVELDDMPALERELVDTESKIYKLYLKLVETPATT